MTRREGERSTARGSTDRSTTRGSLDRSAVRGSSERSTARGSRGRSASRRSAPGRDGRAPAAASTDRLAAWLPRLGGIPALVWGDFVLDDYWRCRSSRVSREAPVLVLDYASRHAEGGGAANAALNLAALGSRVAVVGWVGDDAEGREIRALLERSGIGTDGLLVHPTAATVVKTRVVAGDVHTQLQQVVRIDRGVAFVLGGVERRRLRDALRRAGLDVRAVVLSDYGYDSVTPRLARGPCRTWAARRVTVGLDARYRLADYRGVRVATPNEGEAAAAAGMPIADDASLARAARTLRRTIGARQLVITRGRDGLTLWGPGEAESIPAWGGAAVDVTGAGDAVVATMTLALAAGVPPGDAARLANVAGSVAVGRRGAVAVSRDDLAAALRSRGA